MKKYGLLELDGKWVFSSAHAIGNLGVDYAVEYVDDLLQMLTCIVGSGHQLTNFLLNPLRDILDAGTWRPVFTLLKDLIYNAHVINRPYITSWALSTPLCLEACTNRAVGESLSITYDGERLFRWEEMSGVGVIDWRMMLKTFSRAKLAGDRWTNEGNGWLIQAVYKLLVEEIEPTGHLNNKDVYTRDVHVDVIRGSAIGNESEREAAGQFRIIFRGFGHFESEAELLRSDDHGSHGLRERLRVIADGVGKDPKIWRLVGQAGSTDNPTERSKIGDPYPFRVLQWMEDYEPRFEIIMCFGYVKVP